MNIRRKVILLLILFVSRIFCLAPLWADTVHVVQKGETLYSIAKKYGTSYQDLLDYNTIKDPSKIFVGQKIKIPDSVTEQTYKVQKGDTLFGISRIYSVSVDVIRKANGLTESSVLKEGMVLKIPGAAKTVQNTQTNTKSVQISDTSLKPITVTETKSSADTIAARPVAEASFPANTRWPVKAKSISYLTGKLYGVVITAEENDLVQSLSSGTVISAGPYRGFGKVAIVQAANGYLYVYGGCDILNVREGESIKNGTVLGRIGVDSISKQPQLYFLVYKDNKPVDPASAPRG
ncbi:MAG: M23 family metallopeptidase [Treponema sp.]|mgnify:CR=1 FL=1|uniref:M23 family metallopeptidase n=1 Tax=Gracilinema caldarium TaxID=215591 RepID=A0A7C3IFB1_9SPIR|nr:M23 family metallopeptidase [Treponema sp.]